MQVLPLVLASRVREHFSNPVNSLRDPVRDSVDTESQEWGDVPRCPTAQWSACFHLAVSCALAGKVCEVAWKSKFKCQGTLYAIILPL